MIFCLDFLRLLFKSSTKYFINQNMQIQQSLFDSFQSSLNEFFLEIDLEASLKSKSTNSQKKTLRGFNMATMAEYRQNIIDSMKQDNLSIEKIFNKPKNNAKEEKIIKFITENPKSIRYALSFFFSVLKIRWQYEDQTVKNFYHSNVFRFSEYDLHFKIDDFLNFILQFPQNIYETFKYFFNNMFDEKLFNWFHSFNPIVMNSFHRDILQPIEHHKHIEISIKKTNYFLLPLGRDQNKDVFEYLVNTPPEDPIEIFGYNRNHEFRHFYYRSKYLFDYMVRSHYELEKKLSLHKESVYLNEISPLINEKEISHSLKDFLDFLIESFSTPIDSPLLNLIALMTKVVKMLGDAICIEKTEIYQKIFESSNNTEKEEFFLDDHDIIFQEDVDEKYEEKFEENTSKTSIKLNKFDKNSKFKSSLDSLSSKKSEIISDKSVFNLNFGKSSQILKKKRDEINEINEKSKESNEINVSDIKPKSSIIFENVKIDLLLIY